MAKLYAELSSDKGGRVASKGGDETIDVSLFYKNKRIMSVTLRENADGIHLDRIVNGNDIDRVKIKLT